MRIRNLSRSRMDVLSIDRNPAISSAVLFEIASSRKRIVKRLQRNVSRRKHIVEASSGLYGQLRKLVKRGIPVRISDEKGRLVGQIRLNEDLFVAGSKPECGMTDRMAWRGDGFKSRYDLLAPLEQRRPVSIFSKMRRLF